MKKEENKNVISIDREQKNKTVIIITIFILLIIIASLIALLTQCKIKKIEIYGLDTYTTVEMEEAIRNDSYANNSVWMSLRSKILKKTYLPFIESVDIEVADAHTIEVYATEKIRAGTILSMDEYFYFDKDGIVLESGPTLRLDTPIVEGLKTDTMVIGKKLSLENDETFEALMKITQLASKYNLNITKILFNTLDDIQVISGNIVIELGNNQELDAKMMEIPSCLKSLDGKKGILSFKYYTEQNKKIYFTKTK